MTDRIEIKGIRAKGWHGVLEFERTEGQEFIVDIAFDVDAAAAATTDDLNLTVDYSGIAQLAHARIVGEPFNLIETLAHRIADDILAEPRVERVTVAVHKPHAPIPLTFDDVIVSVHKGR